RSNHSSPNSGGRASSNWSNETAPIRNHFVVALPINLLSANDTRRDAMKPDKNLLALGCALIVGTLNAALPAVAQQQPNVVFILADNVGYGDLGPYGGGELRGAPTPRIDELAREGLRLTQFLVEPACTPSRAALM